MASVAFRYIETADGIKTEPCNQSELIEPLGVNEWHEAYKARLIERGVDPAFAQETLEAVMDDLDYTDSPADAADIELSYWSD